MYVYRSIGYMYRSRTRGTERRNGKRERLYCWGTGWETVAETNEVYCNVPVARTRDREKDDPRTGGRRWRDSA